MTATADRVVTAHHAPDHRPVFPMTWEARRHADAVRRQQEALENLTQRRMPLPGRQVPMRERPTAPPADELERPALTPREVEVLRTWLKLDSKPAVAEALFISLGTVNTHLTRIRAKYADVGRAAPTKASLVARAVQDGHMSLDEL
ncbi:response regulator transcription factor [Gordonia rhizosphera]|uniref:Putative two-component response regulator n=1 Tax=Gordonia rhizosphera NBRC 16068 TaxID=1108045 RepID=K6W0Z0_9ACTN|nr:putative two-component response regulator [Gordonia rhizosphera NBRC 16068]